MRTNQHFNTSEEVNLLFEGVVLREHRFKLKIRSLFDHRLYCTSHPVFVLQGSLVSTSFLFPQFWCKVRNVLSANECNLMLFFGAWPHSSVAGYTVCNSA